MRNKSLTIYHRPDTMKDKLDSRAMSLQFKEMQNEWRKAVKESIGEVDKILLEL